MFILAEVRNTDHCADFFVSLNGKKIDNVHALALPAALGNFIALESVRSALCGEEHDVIMA